MSSPENVSASSQQGHIDQHLLTWNADGSVTVHNPDGQVVDDDSVAVALQASERLVPWWVTGIRVLRTVPDRENTAPATWFTLRAPSRAVSAFDEADDRLGSARDVLLDALARHPSSMVRYRLAQARHTHPVSTLQLLATDPEPGVRAATACRPDLSVRLLAELAQDQDRTVRQAAREQLGR